MRRAWLLILIAPIYAAIMVWLFTAIVMALYIEQGDWRWLPKLLVSPGLWDLSDEFWRWYCLFPACVLVVTQAAFVVPLLRPRPLQRGRAKSLRLSLVMAGFVAAMLCSGLAWAILGAVQLLISLTGGPSDPENAIDIDSPWPILIGWFVVLVICWIFWSAIFFRFA